MKYSINEQAIKQEPLANMLFLKLKEVIDDNDAILYYDFLLEKGDTKDDMIIAKMLLLSPVYGIYLFDTENNNVIDETTQERVDNVYNEVYSRLTRHSELRSRRSQLKYELNSVLIGDVALNDNIDEEYVQCQVDDIPELISIYQPEEPISAEDYRIINGELTGAAKLKRKRDRGNVVENSMAFILNEIEHHIANFDIDQIRAYDLDINSPQRIRGLAGSGKTVVLSYKAAKYYSEDPSAKILYTFYTKALGGSVKSCITRAYKQYSKDEKIDWDHVKIMHGWGNSRQEGVYYSACKDNGVVPLNFAQAKAGAGRGDAFAYACGELLKKKIRPKYDMVLIDEGQDFPKEFYQLCYKLCKTKRVCWAYDEFQNIFDVVIQDEHNTFGFDSENKPLVDLSNGAQYQDIALKRCYRTPRISLISAFAFGLGIYNSKVLQRLESNKQWEDLGFKVLKGNSETGDEMVIVRPEENTPSFSNDRFKENSIRAFRYDNWLQESMAIAELIEDYIHKEGVLPTDVCVICIDKKNVAGYFSNITKELMKYNISTYQLLDSSDSEFFKDGLVTLSTVNKAKGNECGIVIICGLDAVFANPDNVVLRDMLFTSMTRTKGWLVLTGVGDTMDLLVKEFKQLRDNNFELRFIQPDKSATKNIENFSRAEASFETAMFSEIKKLRDAGMKDDDIKRLLNHLNKMLDDDKNSKQ